MPTEQKSKGGFALGDYVEVKDRIKMFYAAHPDGRLVTDRAELWMELDPPHVVVRALAYRSPDDAHPGVGWSWLSLPGSTPYTRGSELENAETSAWGRAIGALGIGIDKSIASKNEVDAKSGTDAPRGSMGSLPPTHGSLIGKLVTQGNQDFRLRETPEGHVLPFRVKDGNRSQIVIAEDALAVALNAIREDALDKRVEVWGSWSDEAFTNKDGREVAYRVLHLTKIETPDWTLPANVEPEAETAPLFDEDAA